VGVLAPLSIRNLWAAYLIKERGVPVETALANARAINLMDTMRMGSSGRQPVETS
jgi:hypothetical protein